MVEGKYDKTKNDTEYLAFYFQNKDGDKLSHTEYKTTPYQREGNTPDQNLAATKNKISNQIKRIGQIVTTYVSVDKYQEAVKGKASFEEVCKAILGILEGQYKDKKVRVKVVYDNNERFTCLPNYHKFAFIESMLIPKAESKIRPLPIDKFKRTVEPDTESKEDTNEFS